MSTIGERLREERQRLGLSQTALAATASVGKHSQINYESDRNAPDANYLTAAAKQGVDIYYVLTGQRTSLGPFYAMSAMFEKKYGPALALARKTAAMEAAIDASFGPQYIPIPTYDALLAAGNGHLNDTDAVTGHLAFRKDWLAEMGVSPASVVIATASGDSMEPTIHNGDMLLIDLDRTSVPARAREAGDTRPSGIYAVLDDGAARVKRVELAAPDTLALLSDNPAFPPEFRPSSSVSIIGRVVWWGHTTRD
jgi:phage repressor protein C with HTH and peptisase S24 domain/DNA-binding XRE family transcriptional regulator